MIKAVIFDLDGVLVDATEWHYKALNKALHIFGYEISREEHMSTYNGLPTAKKLDLLTQRKGLPTKLHSFVNDMKQKYTVQYIEMECKPYFDKLLMVSKLKKDGYKLAVCSNAVKKSVHLMLEKSDILKYIELVLSNQDISNPKPHPEIYLRAFEMLGVNPKEAVIVEDAPHGIAAAKASGAFVCEVSGFEDVSFERINQFIKGCK